MAKLNFVNIKWHALAWACFITYEVGIVVLLSGFFGNFWDYAIHYVLHILLFYFHAFVVLPACLSKGKRHYFKLFVLVLLELAVYTLIKYEILWLFYILNIPIFPPVENSRTYILPGLWRALYFMGFSTAYWFAVTSIKERRKIARLEKIRLGNELANRYLESKLLIAENAYLKAQINPHFLFNTLNFLYNSVSKMDDKIGESVMTLSEIMRYGLAETAADDKVSLESEIDHIYNFIKLNQARFNERLSIVFVVNGDPSGVRIIPLVLMTLTENLFKYGELLDPEIPAQIMLNINQSELVFTTRNYKRSQAKAESHGIGMENLRLRLSIYHNFTLDVKDKPETFEVELKIVKDSQLI